MNDFVLPVGRLVGGSLHKKYDKDAQGRVKDKPTFFFAVAVEKTNPQINEIIGSMYQIAMTDYANNTFIQQMIDHSYKSGFGDGFAWKIDNGDDPKFADRVGYPGSWVFKFSTALDFPTVNNENMQIDPTTVDLGYYVDVAFSVAGNGQTDRTAGLYVNPRCVRLIGYGEKITVGPSPSTMMGQAPASNLPAGCSLTPIAPAGGMPVPGQPVYGGGGAANPVAPGTVYQGQGTGQPGIPVPAGNVQQPVGQSAGNVQQPGHVPVAPAPVNTATPAYPSDMGNVPGAVPAGQLPGGVPGAVPTGTVNNGVPTQVQPSAGTAYHTETTIQPDHGFVNGPGQIGLPGQVPGQ